MRLIFLPLPCREKSVLLIYALEASIVFQQFLVILLILFLIKVSKQAFYVAETLKTKMKGSVVDFV